MGFLCSSVGKESACNARNPGLIQGSGRFPWRKKWQPTLVFLPRKSHRWRSLAGYSPWGCKESDMNIHLSIYWGFPGGTSGKDPAFQYRRCKRHGFDPWVREIPLEKEMATHSSILAWEMPWTEKHGGPLFSFILIKRL